MKNLFKYLSIITLTVFIASCDEELDIWDSEVLDYSGRYVVELQSEDQSAIYLDYHDGFEIDIYNTGANKADEFWLHDIHDDIPLQGKIFINGTVDAFASKSLDFESLSENLSAIGVPETPPTGLGQTITEDREYIKSGIVEGKVLVNAATTLGGNPADSVYVKVRLLSGTVTFNSYLLPADQRDDPDVEQYAWEFDSMAYDNTLDETYVISGHRYTGFPEDQY